MLIKKISSLARNQTTITNMSSGGQTSRLLVSIGSVCSLYSSQSPFVVKILEHFNVFVLYLLALGHLDGMLKFNV